jgi:hypothetical protein
MPSMGSKHSTCSAEAGRRGSFVLILLVTLHVRRGTMFIKLEKPNWVCPPGISQQQVQDPCPRPYRLQGLGFASSPYVTNSGTPGALLEAIIGAVYGFKGANENFTIFTLTTILALASVNRGDLGSFPLPISLYSLLQALWCKKYKSHPPSAGSRAFSHLSQDKMTCVILHHHLG